MKLQNIKNLERLLEVIDSCEGKVELIGEDIRINLKSKIAQYVAFAKLIACEEAIKELEIIAYKQADVNRLIQFMVDGE